MSEINIMNSPFTPREKALWKGEELGARLSFLRNNMFVPHFELFHCLKAIKEKIISCRQEQGGDAIHIIAPTGCGKTTLIRSCQASMPYLVLDESTQVPIVSFDIPSNVTTRSMNAALLRALTDPVAPRASENASGLNSRALALLKKAGTVIIFIDNIQDIPEKRRSGGIKEIGSWIRDLIDDSQCVVVLLGTEESKAVISANAQLRRRCAGYKSINYLRTSSTADLNTFLVFLNDIDLRLPLASPSVLGEKDINLARMFAYATGGIQDYIFKILANSLRAAVQSKRETLTLEDLATGFDAVFLDLAKGVNPFRGQVSRVLSQKGEPLYDILNPEIVAPVQRKQQK